jgi:hypothetical protein
MGFWDFLPGVGDAPKPAPKPAPKQHVPTDLEREKTPTWKADRTQPPKGGTLSQDAWNILDRVGQRTHQNLQVQQGGFNAAGDPTSKGTHDGGGAVDLFVKGMTPQEQLDLVSELRNEGVAAWLRTPEYGWNDPNDEHIHAIFMNDPKLSPVARAQVEQYNNGQNGLANHGPDPFLRPTPTPPPPAPYDPLSSLRQPTPPAPYDPLSSLRQPTPTTTPTPAPREPSDLEQEKTPGTAQWKAAQPSPYDPLSSLRQPTPPAPYDPLSSLRQPTPPAPYDPLSSLRQPTAMPAPTATTAAPPMNAGGYGFVTPPVPAEVLPAPHPGATDYDRARALGQEPPPPVALQPSQRTAYEVDYLKSLGWTMPKNSPLVKGPQMPSEMYSPNSLTNLADYTYQVDQAERDRITAKYRNVEGFVPPSDTQGLPNPDTTPFEADVATAELTWEAYDNLSDDARTAVDLNGLLVAARELDLSKEYKLEGDELNEYNKRTTGIFGKPDTSTKVAPNVVKLLHDINWSAVGQDLDEFLSLERGFTADDLQDLDKSFPDVIELSIEETGVPVPSGGGYNTGGTAATGITSNFDQVRSVENMAAVDNMLAEVAGKRFDAVMADPALRLWNLPSSLTLAQTGTTTRPTGSGVPFGYGTQTDRTSEQGKAKEAFYQSAYNYLSDASTTDLQPLWDEMSAMGFTPEDTQEFWRFVDDRTRQERRWGQVGSPYGEAGRSYQGPDEIRKLVGLEG